MANDDWYKNLPPEARKALDKASQNLKDKEVQLNESANITLPRRADYANSQEPKLNETVFPNQGKEQNQRGAQVIQQYRDQAHNESQASKEADKSKDQSGTTATKNKDQDKDKDR